MSEHTKEVIRKPTTPKPAMVDSEGSTHDTEEKALDLERTETTNFPDGGFRAWTVAFGASSAFLCTLGFTNSFGIFQTYYMENQLQHDGASKVSWIGGLQAWVIFATGLIGGPLFDRYGAWILRPGALLYILGIMLTSISTQYWHFMLAQGLLTGIGNSLIMFPAFAAVPQWFDKKRGAAMGLAIAGSSIGAVMLPIILNNLLNKTNVGFGWSVRILGFILLPFLVITCLTVDARLPPRKTQFFLAEPFKKPMYLLLVAANFFAMTGMFVPMFLIPTYAEIHGMSKELAFYLLAILNGASLLGRVIPGILGDKFGRINAFALASISTGIIVFCWPFASTNAGIIIFTIFFGFCSGAIISGSTTAITLTTDNPKNLGTYLGMGMALSSFSALLGPPASGAMLDRYHDFTQISYFCGSMTVVGGILAFWAKKYTVNGLFGRT